MREEPRKRGTGSVYQRGDRLWAKFYVNGKAHREPATVQLRNGLTVPARTIEEAEKYLAGRLRKVHAHQEDPTKPFIAQRQRRLTIDDLLSELELDFRRRGKDSPPNRSHIKHAKADFGHHRAVDLTAHDVNEYIDKRLNPTDGQRPSAKASINRVLEMLGQAYTLADIPAPKICYLSEKGNTRKGFVVEQVVRSIMANLPTDYAHFTLYGWLTGWRKGEIDALGWDNEQDGCIVLAEEDSKEGEARLIVLEGELAELIELRRKARRVEINGTAQLASRIFHVNGKPIGDFRKAWQAACCAAGVGKRVCPKCRTDVSVEGKCATCGQTWTREDLKYMGLIFHDLRRSACRNMINANVPQIVAMAISGHKTDSMFRRYAIVDNDQIRTALRQTQQYLRGTAGAHTVTKMSSEQTQSPGTVQERAQFGHNSGTAQKKESGTD